MFFFDVIANAISNILGTIIVTLSAGLTLSLGLVTWAILKIIAVLFGMVFYLAYMFMTLTVVVDFGRLIGMGSFPSPDMLKPLPGANYWHIYIIVSNNPAYQTALAGGRSIVVLLSDVYGIVRGLFVALMSIVVVAMMMRILYEYISVEPKDLYQDMELLMRKMVELLFALVVIFVLIPGALGLISVLPVKIGDYTWVVMGTVNNTTVVQYCVNNIADIYASGINDYLNAVTHILSGGPIDLGTALSYSMLMPLFTIGVVFIIGASLIGIIIAPISLVVKRIVLSFFVLMLYPVYLLVTYVGELLGLAGRGLGNFGGGILDNIVREFASALNSFSNLMTQYLRHMIGTAIGIPLFVFALRMTGDIARAVASNSFINTVTSLAPRIASPTSALVLTATGGLGTITSPGASSAQPIAPASQEYLMLALVKFMLAFGFFAFTGLLFAKLEQIDQPGSILEFGRLQAVVAQGLQAGLSLSLLGLTAPLGGAGAVFGKLGMLAGSKLTALGHKTFGGALTRLGMGLATMGYMIPGMMLGAKTPVPPGFAETTAQGTGAPGAVPGVSVAPGATAGTGIKTGGTGAGTGGGAGATETGGTDMDKKVIGPGGGPPEPSGSSGGRFGWLKSVAGSIGRTGYMALGTLGVSMLAPAGYALSVVAERLLGTRALAEGIRRLTLKGHEKMARHFIAKGLEEAHYRHHVSTEIGKIAMLTGRGARKIDTSIAGILSPERIDKLGVLGDAFAGRYGDVINALVQRGRTLDRIIIGRLDRYDEVYLKELGLLDKYREMRTTAQNIARALAETYGIPEGEAYKLVTVMMAGRMLGVDTRSLLREYVSSGDVVRAYRKLLLGK